jgi:ABC-type sugar transport system permease subunit
VVAPPAAAAGARLPDRADAAAVHRHADHVVPELERLLPEERGFAGFDNYVRVLTDVSTRNAIVTTVVLTVTVVLVSLLLGLGIALLLDRTFRGRASSAR